MRMHVDKARRHDPPTGVDFVPCTALQAWFKSRNVPPADTHIRHHPRCACAVNDCAMSNE